MEKKEWPLMKIQSMVDLPEILKTHKQEMTKFA
jgi:hypothetical protein